MRLSEVIKELERDNTQIFESGTEDYRHMECKTLNGAIEFLIAQSRYTGAVRLDREWKKVLQPMTFDEVINNGEFFKCEHQNIKEKGYWIISRFVQMLYLKKFTSTEILDILKNGKFYN